MDDSPGLRFDCGPVKLCPTQLRGGKCDGMLFTLELLHQACPHAVLAGITLYDKVFVEIWTAENWCGYQTVLRQFKSFNLLQSRFEHSRVTTLRHVSKAFDLLAQMWDVLSVDRKSTRLNSSHLVISYA